jgi:hypothetical protein
MFDVGRRGLEGVVDEWEVLAVEAEPLSTGQ